MLSTNGSLHLSGSDASLDIAPLSGTALFVSGSTEQSIVLSVLPDTIPEITEVIPQEAIAVVVHC